MIISYTAAAKAFQTNRKPRGFLKSKFIREKQRQLNRKNINEKLMMVANAPFNKN